MQTPSPTVRTLLRAAVALISFMALVAVGGTAAAANGVFVPAGDAPSGTSATGTNEPTSSPTASESPEPTVGPTASPTASPTATSMSTSTPTPQITEVDVDIELNFAEGRDRFIDCDFDRAIRFEGSYWDNYFLYYDRDGRLVRGSDLSALYFATRVDAQRFYDATGRSSTVARILDRNGNGVAAEVNEGVFTADTADTYGVQRGGQVETWPTGGVDTGGE